MVGERWVHVGSSADSESCGALSAEPGYGAMTSTESPLRGRGEGPGGSVLLCLVAGGCRELTYSAGVAVTATISFPSQDAATKAVSRITQVVNLRREWIVLPAISKTHLKFEISDFSLTCFPWKFPVCTQRSTSICQPSSNHHNKPRCPVGSFRSFSLEQLYY